MDSIIILLEPPGPVQSCNGIGLPSPYYVVCTFVWVWHLVHYIDGKHKLRVFENRVLRGIFGAKRDQVTYWWRKLQNEEPRGCAVHWIWGVRWAGHMACMVDDKCIQNCKIEACMGEPDSPWSDRNRMSQGRTQGGGGLPREIEI